MSNNVNIEGNNLKIDKIVNANTLKILTVAIAQAESWYLNVRSALNNNSDSMSKITNPK